MSKNVKSLLNDYGEKLDIIYDDGLQPGNTYGYDQLVYWDSYNPPPPKISISSPENKTYTTNNVSLTFTLNKPATWIGYSLDSQPQISLAGNTTLLNLSKGPHNVTVYAKDEFEVVGVSEAINFFVEQPSPEPFPTTLVIASSAVAAAVAIGIPVYLKKRHR
jgi:hypothetical protein